MRKKKIGAFDIINYSLMILLMASFVIPFWIIIAASVSDNGALQAEGISLQIKGFTFEAYKFLFTMNDIFIRSIGVSFLTSLLTALLSVAVCTLAAYVLSKKYLVGRKFFTVIFMITMFFSGGTIPTYLLIRGIGIYDTIWALVLPGVVSTYNILLIRNYFYGLPDAMEEAAKIDGASDVDVLIRIFAPLSVPMMCTIGIMTFIGKWNEWLPSLLYLGATNKSLWTAQYVLRQMLRDMQTLFGNAAGGSVVNAPLIAAKNAAIVVVVLPLIVISPVLHKYFAKGLTSGSVKG